MDLPAPARPTSYNTHCESLQRAYVIIPSAKLHVKVLPFTSKQTQRKLVKIPASKRSSKKSMTEQKAVPYMFEGILAPSCSCYNAPGFS